MLQGQVKSWAREISVQRTDLISALSRETGRDLSRHSEGEEKAEAAEGQATICPIEQFSFAICLNVIINRVTEHPTCRPTNPR